MKIQLRVARNMLAKWQRMFRISRGFSLFNSAIEKKDKKDAFEALREQALENQAE